MGTTEGKAVGWKRARGAVMDPSRWARLQATICVVLAIFGSHCIDAEDMMAGLSDEVEVIHLGEDSLIQLGGPGDYKKQGKVPQHLNVVRRLVTASWVRCKLACDGDKTCEGFKFTPMANNQLPLCEMLAAPGGSFMKNDFHANEAITKKMEKAKELVKKARVVEKRSSSAAEKAQKGTAKAKRRTLEAKATHATLQAKIKLSHGAEKAAKKQAKATDAALKRARLEVKEIEMKKRLGWKKQEMKSEMKTEKQIKRAKMDVNKELASKKKKMLAHNKELKAKDNSKEGKMKKKTKNERHAKELFKKRSQRMKTKEEQVAASMSLIRKIGVQNVQLMAVKKKIDKAEAELKYRYDNKMLKKEKARLDKSLAKQKGKFGKAMKKMTAAEKKLAQTRERVAKAKMRLSKGIASEKDRKLIRKETDKIKKMTEKKKLAKQKAAAAKKLADQKAKKEAARAAAKKQKAKAKTMEAKSKAEDKKEKAQEKARLQHELTTNDPEKMVDLYTRLKKKVALRKEEVRHLRLKKKIRNMTHAELTAYHKKVMRQKAALEENVARLRREKAMLAAVKSKNIAVMNRAEDTKKSVGTAPAIWLKKKYDHLDRDVVRLQNELKAQKAYGTMIKKAKSGGSESDLRALDNKK